MKLSLAFTLGVILMSCSCSTTLKSTKPTVDVVNSSTRFSVDLADGWERVPNSVPIRLPSISFGDITVRHVRTNTIVFLSSIQKIESLTASMSEFRSSFAGKADILVTDVVTAPELKDSVEVDVKSTKFDTQFRIIMVNGEHYTHIIQCIITAPGVGDVESSKLLRTFKM